AADGEGVVDEHRPVGHEAVIADRHELTDERVRLDSAALADDGLSLDLDERANERVVADRAAVEVDGLHESHVRAEPNVDDARRDDLGLPRGGRAHARTSVARARSRMETTERAWAIPVAGSLP